MLDLTKITLLDGGFGTMAMARGMKMGEKTEMLVFTMPDIVRGIHEEYVKAGSQIIMADTFGANRKKLAGCGHRPSEVIMRAIQLAKQAAGKRAYVALDIGPIGEMLEPMGTLTFEEAYDIFQEMVIAGSKAGADAIMIETMTDMHETKAALLAAKENCSLPVFVSMSFEETGRTFTGCTPVSFARTMTALGADAVGVNCSLGPKELEGIVRQIAENTTLPVIAKPNAGLPDPIDGHYSLSDSDFAEYMKVLVSAGATLVGGCCGTTPRSIAALKAAVADAMPAERTYVSESFVCTPETPCFITSVTPIGERINPTGKKKLQQALLNEDMDYILSLAVSQKDAGAMILDVNVGYPGVDEENMLPRVVKALQSVTDLPLQLDSVNPKALEKALRIVNGIAAVNSVNGNDAVMDTILPVVKKYGACVVGLTMDDTGLPDSWQKRVEIAERILNKAISYGIARENVWIDCLTMTVSAQQSQAYHTLKAVREVTEKLGLKTVLGVSNISFGLPNRPLMTQIFLTEAMQAGLKLPIINPNSKEVMDAVCAHRVLANDDIGSNQYIARFAITDATPVEKKTVSAQTNDLQTCIIKGIRGEAAQAAKKLLETKTELEIVEQELIPALDVVGEKYEKSEVFLPQLLSAAQAAQSVFEIIREQMESRGAQMEKKGTLAIATVRGDIHDIGKNIVKTVMENYGYEVIDLGRDVPVEKVVDIVKQKKLRLVGLSALMTTTLSSMEETVKALNALPEPPVTFVGGAVVTPGFAESIGATYYTRDARASVEVARKVFG